MQGRTKRSDLVHPSPNVSAGRTEEAEDMQHVVGGAVVVVVVTVAGILSRVSLRWMRIDQKKKMKSKRRKKKQVAREHEREESRKCTVPPDD